MKAVGKSAVKRHSVIFTLLLMTVILVLSSCSLSLLAKHEGGPRESSERSKKTLRIYCWNLEFQGLFNSYFSDKLPADIKVEWVITPNENNAYQDKLDMDLAVQDEFDNKIDIFLIEADYALKYINSPYVLDVVGDVGLSESDLKNQYAYTQEIARDSKGALKAVSWQATPGLFAYRRSIARDVFGTDDPAQIQMQLSDWDSFNRAAAAVKKKGYYMLSGFDDSYRVFSNNVSSPWVNKDNYIEIDPSIMDWVAQTKTYTDKGYNHRTTLWDETWAKDQGPEGKVFGFFYSTWGINFTLLGNSLAVPVDMGGKEEVGNGIFGDYAVTVGPESFYWGGTWICAAKGGDNVDIVRDLMKTMTCDTETMKQITLDTQDFTNNSVAMDELAHSDYKSAFLGGQNHIAVFAEAAPNIDMKNVSEYDQGMNEGMQTNMKPYFLGQVSEEDAIADFYKSAIEKYPQLKQPDNSQ